MSKIFLISGLGADYRLFQNLNLEGYEVVHVHWIHPANEDTLTSYAKNLINQYHIQENDIVIGVSLGGMLTIEIAKQIKLNKAILISSIKSSAEAPFYFPIFRRLPLYKIIPRKLFTSVGFLVEPVFGRMSADDSALFKSMLKNSSPEFMRWAMHAVLQWRSETVLDNVYHITGDKDLVFSHKRIKGATIVNGGTHIMVFDKAGQVNKLLKEILDK